MMTMEYEFELDAIGISVLLHGSLSRYGVTMIDYNAILYVSRNYNQMFRIFPVLGVDGFDMWASFWLLSVCALAETESLRFVMRDGEVVAYNVLRKDELPGELFARQVLSI
jgi:hypothetical protein